MDSPYDSPHTKRTPKCCFLAGSCQMGNNHVFLGGYSDGFYIRAGWKASQIEHGNWLYNTCIPNLVEQVLLYEKTQKTVASPQWIVASDYG